MFAGPPAKAVDEALSSLIRSPESGQPGPWILGRLAQERIVAHNPGIHFTPIHGILHEKMIFSEVIIPSDSIVGKCSFGFAFIINWKILLSR